MHGVVLLSLILSPELGRFALALACCLAGAQTVLPLWGAWRGRNALMAAARPLAWGQFIALLLGFC